MRWRAQERLTVRKHIKNLYVYRTLTHCDAIEHTQSERNGESENAFVNPTRTNTHTRTYKWYHQVPVIFRAQRIILADTCQRHPVRESIKYENNTSDAKNTCNC